MMMTMITMVVVMVMMMMMMMMMMMTTILSFVQRRQSMLDHTYLRMISTTNTQGSRVVCGVIQTSDGPPVF